MAENSKKVYDLEERTARFGEDIVKLAKKIPRNIVNNPIVGQLIKSGTSTGANYCEADCAETRKDFEHKIAISNKETKETKFWLRQLSNAEPAHKTECITLWKEANELNLIFLTIIKKSKTNGIKDLKH